MNNLPQGFYVDHLYCFPIGPSGSQEFYYLPTAPSIEVVGNEVKASLLNSDDAAVLALQIIWEADANTIDKAKSEIRNRYPDLSLINLNVANLRGVTATLNINKNGKVLHSIGPINTSGPNVFRVALQDTLRASEKEAVLNTFDAGKTGIITITYNSELHLNEVADAEFVGDLAEEVKALAPREVVEKGHWGKKDKVVLTPSPSLQECKDDVNKSIANKSLIIQHKNSANVSQQAKDTVSQELINDIAQRIFSKIKQMGKNAQYMSSFAISIKKTEPESIKFDLNNSYDLEETITTNGGQKLIKNSSTSIPEPKR
ncbi:hypothetical protein K5X82_18425 [Halosquirtibacter xylanolyticus]|uniref:hypothetical protein n=1 Tax=Halosquirtibacter xylanolyticus TaxID=3374599 RepID=UPI003749DCED|nr:hypothetical protein K5X82_18425 [Prolixibacteraceae bacterium]